MAVPAKFLFILLDPGFKVRLTSVVTLIPRLVSILTEANRTWTIRLVTLHFPVKPITAGRIGYHGHVPLLKLGLLAFGRRQFFGVHI